MFSILVSMLSEPRYVFNKSVDVCEPLATTSSYIWYPIPLSGSTVKFGPFKGGQYSPVSPTIVTVSIIGLDCNFETQIS